MSQQASPEPSNRSRGSGLWKDALLIAGALFLMQLGVHSLVELSHLTSVVVGASLDATLMALLSAPLVAWTLYRRRAEDSLPAVDGTRTGSPHQRVRLVLHGTLVVLALALAATTIVRVVHIRVAARTPALINLSGRQRMLSQAVDRELAAGAAYADSLRLRQLIKSMVDEGAKLSGEIDSLSRANPAEFASVQQAFRGAHAGRLALLATLRQLDAPSSDAAAQRAAIQRAEAYLPMAEALTAALQQLAEQQNRSAALRAAAVASIFLVLLLIIAVLVVEPVVRLIRRQHAATANRAAELERLSMAAQHTNNSVVFTDAERRITWVNAGFTRVTGFSEAEARGRSPGELLQCARTDPQTVVAMREALNAGRSFRGEVLNVSKDGHEYWLDLDIQPLRDAAGVLTGFMAIETDITEQVAQKQRLSTIFDTVSEGLVQVGHDGALLEWNAAAERILGLTGDQIRGRDAIDPRWGSIRLDGSPLPEDELPAIFTLRTGQPLRGFVHGIRHSNGARRWISVSTAAARSPRGDIVAVVASFSDITEQREQEGRLQLVVEAAGLGTWDCHVPTRATRFNERFAQMLGYAPSDFTPHLRQWDRLLHPDDRTAAWTALRGHLEGRQAEFSHEHRLRRADGTWAWVLVTGRITERTDTGEPLRVAGVVLDVSVSKQAELRAARAQERFEAAVAGTSDGLWDWSVGSAALWFSARCWELLGYPADQPYPSVTLATFQERLHPQERTEVLDALNSLRKEKAPLDIELRLQLFDGSYRWFRMRCKAQRGTVSQATRLAGSIQDIDAKKRAIADMQQARLDAEAALREVSALRTALDEHSILSIADRRGRIIDINTGFCRISGYEREELLGQDHRLLNSGAHGKAFWINVWRTISSGRAWRGEVCNRRKDGSYYWVDSTIVPYMNADGAIEKYVSIRFDVTAQKKSEDSLQRATTALEEAQALAGLGSWSFDLQTGVIEWSKQVFALFGRSEADGPPDYDSVMCDYAPEDAARLNEAVGLAMTAGEPYSLVMRTAARNPEVRYVRGEGIAKRGPNQEIVSIVGTVTDVTAEVERENALRQARHQAEELNAQLVATNQILEMTTARSSNIAAEAQMASIAKSEFLANMSHEIRTPLTAILGYTDILRDEAIAERRATGGFDTIRRAGEHLLAVINDILDLTKIEANKLVIEEIETSLPALLLEVDSLMRARASAKGLQMHLALRSPVPSRIVSDPTRLRQILMNLVGNAVKFTEAGSVHVSACVVSAADGDCMRIEVQDTGPGMTDEQATNLFQPFVQADSSVTRKHGGSGLGLTICRRLASMMGGSVNLDATAPGRGAQFSVVLPLVPIAPFTLVDNLDACSSPQSEVVSPTSGATQVRLDGRILLAEDGEDNQRLIAFHLRKAGADVIVVSNGALALDALQEAEQSGTPYNLLVTDMQMPEMDGYTLARTLRQQGSTLPIVALTAHAMAEDRQKCLDAGCDDYATKPIDKRHLLATCARWIGGQSAIADIFPDTFGSGHLLDDVDHTAALSAPRSPSPHASEMPQACEDVLRSDLADDPEMSDLVEQFLTALVERMGALDAAFVASDWATVARISHQLKGAAGGYGYPSISDAASQLESLAKEGRSSDGMEDARDRLLARCRAALRAKSVTQTLTAAQE